MTGIEARWIEGFARKGIHRWTIRSYTLNHLLRQSVSYIWELRRASNFRNSERRVPLHAAFDLYVERQRWFSCHRCIPALWAFVTHLKSPSTTRGVTKILAQHAGHLETRLPRIVSRHDILREFLVKIKDIDEKFD